MSMDYSLVMNETVLLKDIVTVLPAEVTVAKKKRKWIAD